MKRNLSLAPEVVLVGLLNFLHSVDFLVHRALLYERGGCERTKFNTQTHTCCSFWSVTHDSVRLCRLIDCVFKETQLVNRKLRVECESDTMLVVSYGPKCVFWTLWNMILKQQGA